MLKKALAEIAVQQAKVKEYSTVWCVGEQLKDILQAQPQAAEIVLTDLQQPGMGLAVCEKKIEDFAGAHKQGNRGCCPPREADRIIREFYGIGAAQEPKVPPKPAAKTVNLLDFM